MERKHFDIIDSTFTYLIENYDKLESFFFVDAKFQSNGIGRNNRKWESNSGDNLLFSFLIKEKNLIENYQLLSLYIGYVIASFLEKEKISNVSIKWPNDIYVNDKKIAGILLKGNVPNYIAIGVGLNVNQKVFDGEYRITPTSMILERNNKFDLDDLANRLFIYIEQELIFFDINKMKEYINTHNYLYNKEVSFEVDNKTCNGIVKGINDDGSLSIFSNNKTIKVSSNEISLIKTIN